jgi:hypothetical protein
MGGRIRHPKDRRVAGPIRVEEFRDTGARMPTQSRRVRDPPMARESVGQAATTSAVATLQPP